MLYIDTKKIIFMAFFCLFAAHTQAMEKSVTLHLPDPYGADLYRFKITPGEGGFRSDTYENLDKNALENRLRLYKIKSLFVTQQGYGSVPRDFVNKQIRVIIDVLKKAVRLEGFHFEDFANMNLSQKDFRTILRSLPEGLKRLSLRNNNLKKLPPEIVGRFLELKLLNLYGNKLQELPSIELLPQLETLNIENNKFTADKIKELRIKKLPNTKITADH